MTDRQAYTHPRDQLLETMNRIYRYRMTTTSGGNLSLRGSDRALWITPARVDKGNLTRGEMVRIDPAGRVEGPHPPSSELPFHQAIYAARPDIDAIVHAHPVALVAFSICRMVPDVRLFHQAHEICGSVGLAPYALPGSLQLGERIADSFARGNLCVILENHGVVVGGRDLPDAFRRFETLEFTAKTIIKARLLGDVRLLSDAQLALARQDRPPLETGDTGPITTAEQEVRQQLCAFIRRGYQQRLFISTQGSFSARIDAQSFVITPHACDRSTIDVEELVRVREETVAPGRQPSQATRMHAAIYARHPELRAIVNADPVNATAFGVTDVLFDSRTIPESYLFLRNVQRIPYGVQFEHPEAAAERLSPGMPVALLENDGVLVCGRSILDAFDRLEVLESTAEAIINSRALGRLTPMDAERISELDAAFGIA